MDDAVSVSAGRNDVTEFTTFSLYNGRELMGFYVILESGEFEAFDRTSGPLGTLSKAKDARRAIVDAEERIP